MYLPIYFWLGIVFKVVLIISIRQSTLSPKRKTFIWQKNPNSDFFLQYSQHFHVPQVFLYRILLLLRRISIEHWANIKTRNASDLISKHQRIQLYQSTSKLCLHSSSFFVPSHQEVKCQRGILQSLAENNFSSGSWLKQHFHFAKFFTIISRILEVWRWTCSSTRSLQTPLGWNKIMFTSKFKVDCCLDSAWLGPVHGWKNQKHWNSPTIGTLCHHLHPRQWTHEHLPRKRATARHLLQFLCFDIPLSFIYIPLSFICYLLSLHLSTL